MAAVKKRVIPRAEMGHLDAAGLSDLEKNLQPHEQTKGTLKNIAAEKGLQNPITGKRANTYTAATNREELPSPKAVHPAEVSPQRDLNREHALKSERTQSADAPVGYDIDKTISPQYQTFVSGRKEMFPNEGAARGNPAINEPHEAAPGQRTLRRAEDLSSREHQKGENILRNYGFDPENPTGDLARQRERGLNRVTSENVAAGVNVSSSHMFYGGDPNTPKGMEVGSDSWGHHVEGVLASHDRFQQSAQAIAAHPKFQEATQNMRPRERHDVAARLSAVAVADTSPRARWRTRSQKHPWPNIEQAEESSVAALDDREPRTITGFSSNAQQASLRVGNAVADRDFDTHKNSVGPKRGAFEGAMTDRDAADAFNTADVHDASASAPHLPTEKSKMYNTPDGKVAVPPDMEPPKGSGPVMKVDELTGKLNHETGLSKPEKMLAEGGGIIHSLTDRASREVAAKHGISRGVDYADNTHAQQAALWGSQQMRRGIVKEHEQYPVTRRFEDEGINVPKDHDIRNIPMNDTTNLSPKFARTGEGESHLPEVRTTRTPRRGQ